MFFWHHHGKDKYLSWHHRLDDIDLSTLMLILWTQMWIKKVKGCFYAIFRKIIMAAMTLVNKIRFLHPELPLKCFKLLSQQHRLLLIMLVLVQVREIYTLNDSNSISVMSTYHHLMVTTTSASFSDKKKPLTKKEVVMSSLSNNKNEDYLDEDSDEIYDDKVSLNYSGKWNFSPMWISFQFNTFPSSKRNDSGKSLWIYMW